MSILVRRRSPLQTGNKLYLTRERIVSIVKDIESEIVIEIAVLSESDSGYTKEINLVSWNGAKPKYDIRSWSPGREKCGKGITLTEDEAKNLFLALKNQFQSLS